MPLQITGCHEEDIVSVNTISLDRLNPFYQSVKAIPTFKHSSTNRKSFSRGNQKFLLSLQGGSKTEPVLEEHEDMKERGFDGLLSPTLSLAVVSETVLQSGETSPMSSLPPVHLPLSVGTSADLAFCGGTDSSLRHGKLAHFSESLSHNDSYGMEIGGSSRFLRMAGPNSLNAPNNYNIYSLGKKVETETEEQHVEIKLNESNPPILINYDNYDIVEDFPVNQNFNSMANNYKPGSATSTINASSKSIKKSTNNFHKRTTNSMVSNKQTTTGIFSGNKLSQVSSVSSMELHKLDDNMVLKKSSSSSVVNRNKRSMGSQLYKENSHQKNISEEIITKPIRSRTTLDMRAPRPNKTLDKHNSASIPVRFSFTTK